MHEMQILAAGLQTGRALRWRVARVYCVEAMFKVRTLILLCKH